MKIEITNRASLEKISRMPFMKHTAVISITDCDLPSVNLTFKPQFLLELKFDDVPVGKAFEDEVGHTLTDEQIRELESKYNALTEGQVESIVMFYMAIKDKVEILICQCEHGQSRSAAVAAAISQHMNQNAIDIFDDDRYFPNKSVYRSIYERLKG